MAKITYIANGVKLMPWEVANLLSTFQIEEIKRGKEKRKNKKIENLDEMFDDKGRFIPQYARGIKASGEKGLCGLDLEIRRVNESWQEVRCSGRGILTSVLHSTRIEAVALHCRNCRKSPQEAT